MIKVLPSKISAQVLFTHFKKKKKTKGILVFSLKKIKIKIKNHALFSPSKPTAAIPTFLLPPATTRMLLISVSLFTADLPVFVEKLAEVEVGTPMLQQFSIKITVYNMLPTIS